MTDLLYQILAKIGYTHPLHPPMTHVVVGMVIGAFVFSLGARILRRPTLMLTARHCIVLALISFIPTVLLGYLDWRHYYGGAWLFPIKMKLALAAILLVLLLIADLHGRKAERKPGRIVLICTLCFINVTTLGYFGGQLVFGGRGPQAARETAKVKVSAEQFINECGSCHPDGGNIFKANLPLRNAPQLADFKTFLAYIRSPQARDGSQTIMPAFPSVKVSDQQARVIYEYVVRVLKKR
jgi:mono/diheme cytochrome c family protein